MPWLVFFKFEFKFEHVPIGKQLHSTLSLSLSLSLSVKWRIDCEICPLTYKIHSLNNYCIFTLVFQSHFQYTKLPDYSFCSPQLLVQLWIEGLFLSSSTRDLYHDGVYRKFCLNYSLTYMHFVYLGLFICISFAFLIPFVHIFHLFILIWWWCISNWEGVKDPGGYFWEIFGWTRYQCVSFSENLSACGRRKDVCCHKLNCTILHSFRCWLEVVGNGGRKLHL